MKRTTRFLLAAVALAAVVVPAFAAPSASSVKETLQSLYNKEDAATTAKDVPGMMADYDQNVVAVMANGDQKTYPDILAAAKQVTSMAKTIKSTTTVKSVDLSESSAVAETDSSVILTIAEPTTQNDMTIETTSTAKDTWKKEDGHWKIVKSVEVTHNATVDGQPMPGI